MFQLLGLLVGTVLVLGLLLQVRRQATALLVVTEERDVLRRELVNQQQLFFQGRSRVHEPSLVAAACLSEHASARQAALDAARRLAEEAEFAGGTHEDGDDQDQDHAWAQVAAPFGGGFANLRVAEVYDEDADQPAAVVTLGTVAEARVASEQGLTLPGSLLVYVVGADSRTDGPLPVVDPDVEQASIFYQRDTDDDLYSVLRQNPADYVLLLLRDPSWASFGGGWSAPLGLGLPFLAQHMEQAQLDVATGWLPASRPRTGGAVDAAGQGRGNCLQFVLSPAPGDRSAPEGADDDGDVPRAVASVEEAPFFGTRVPTLTSRCLRCSATGNPVLLVRSDALKVALDPADASMTRRQRRRRQQQQQQQQLQGAPSFWLSLQLKLFLTGARAGLCPEFQLHQAWAPPRSADEPGVARGGDITKIRLSVQQSPLLSGLLDEEHRLVDEAHAQVNSYCACLHKGGRHFVVLDSYAAYLSWSANFTHTNARVAHPLNDFGRTPFRGPYNWARVAYAAVGPGFLRPCYYECN